jgi:uncharacterized protein (TIGR00251 family)
MDYLRTFEHGLDLLLYVQPGASKAGWAGTFGEPPRLKLKISAPPRDGEANDAVLEFVARELGLKKNEVELLRGEKSRLKDVRLYLPKNRVSDVRELLLARGRP